MTSHEHVYSTILSFRMVVWGKQHHKLFLLVPTTSNPDPNQRGKRETLGLTNQISFGRGFLQIVLRR